MKSYIFWNIMPFSPVGSPLNFNILHFFKSHKMKLLNEKKFSWSDNRRKIVVYHMHWFVSKLVIFPLFPL
jgi:hypothetical protein